MSEETKKEKSLVSVLVLNVKGQLGKVTTFFSEHNLNILRLVLSAADKDDKIHKIIAYIEGDRKKVNEMCERLLNVENVLKVTNFQTNSEYIEKEVCLIKILNSEPKAPDVSNFVADANGRTIFTNQNITIYRIEDNEENVNDFVNKLVDVTKNIEISRSGMIAMAIDNKIDNVIDVDL